MYDILLKFLKLLKQCMIGGFSMLFNISEWTIKYKFPKFIKWMHTVIELETTRNFDWWIQLLAHTVHGETQEVNMAFINMEFVSLVPFSFWLLKKFSSISFISDFLKYVSWRMIRFIKIIVPTKTTTYPWAYVAIMTSE